MQLKIVDGNAVEPHPQANLISYVIDGRVAIDAGALGLLPLHEQKQIQAVFLSHAHVDHIATLALFIDNVYVPGPRCVKLYGSASTIADLQQHLFNDRLWPDLVRLSASESPFLEWEEIRHGQSVDVHGLQLTAFDVDHSIPTLGYVAATAESAVALVSDTAPYQPIWDFLNQIEQLKAVFLEISFPDSMQWLAEKSKHLTPSWFLAETQKLTQPVDWFITHVKPEYARAIAEEVSQLRFAHCQLAMASQIYEF